MPTPLLPRGVEWKEYRRALRVYQFLRENRHGLIAGLPGGGKSTYTLMATAFWSDGPVVFSVPLRQLRDQLYQRIQSDHRFSDIRDRIVIVKAHDETCEALAQRLRERPRESYFKLLAEHLSAAERGEEQCKWKETIGNIIRLLARKESVVILTTHQIAFMLLMLSWVAKQRDVLFIFDEAEDLFIKIGEPVNLDDIELIKVINKKLYRRLRGLFRPPHQELRLGWIHGKVVLNALANSVFISATFPPIILEKLGLTEDEYPVYRFKSKRATDILLMYKRSLYMKEYEEWKLEVHSAVLEIAKTAKENGWAIGIVSKNETQSKDLTNMLEGAGFVVWSDHRRNLVDYSEADVVIIRPLGKGYRGVSFFTRKNKDKNIKDFRVIIAFFQRKGINRNDIHPIFYQMLSDDINSGVDEIGDFIEQMVYAKNFQSVFRFNRFRNHEHLLVLMEWDYWKVFNMYAWRYFNKYARRLDFDNINDVVNVANSIIRNL